MGKVENTERFLQVSLYQGKNKGSVATGLRPGAMDDPTLVCCAYKKQRFFLFTRREPVESDDGSVGRDVFNERPTIETTTAQPSMATPANGAVIHTTKGDIHIKLFPQECPKAVENFVGHSRNNYYNGLLFHRVVKGFMIQTGDPLGDGTGGKVSYILSLQQLIEKE